MGGKPGGDVAEKTRPKSHTREPPLYRVLLHNDDYTTMEFVVEVLVKVFLKAPTEAFSLMMKVHHEGLAVCGVYRFEVAETKVDRVHSEARARGFPLRASMEEE